MIDSKRKGGGRKQASDGGGEGCLRQGRERVRNGGQTGDLLGAFALRLDSAISMMRRSVTRSDPTSGELSPAKTATPCRLGPGRHASVASPAARPGLHEREWIAFANKDTHRELRAASLTHALS